MKGISRRQSVVGLYSGCTAPARLCGAEPAHETHPPRHWRWATPQNGELGVRTRHCERRNRLK
jgi:hypothetical protein